MTGAGRLRCPRRPAEGRPAQPLDPSSEEATPPTPIIPGPAWAPSTGPTSDTNAGSEPKMSRHSSTRCRAVSWSWMCWTTHASAPTTWRLAGELDQPLEGAPSRAHALDRGDLLPEGQDRLDPERRAQPCLSRADPASLAQVLERVESRTTSRTRRGTARRPPASPRRRPPHGRRAPPRAPPVPGRRPRSGCRRRGSAPRPCPRPAVAGGPAPPTRRFPRSRPRGGSRRSPSPRPAAARTRR